MAASTGLPLAHVGSEVAGKYVVTGSPTVFVGSTAIGQADRCPSCSPAVGQPVNPILGAKL
ncbi:hypothetical protein, partial [Pseudomonas sp. RIT-PI-AD]|uniref:hypothetical protein n=1 Tax=Pseudomonas sp. RIT-PI-AD TaxID=3035294 RepID=UPI0021DAA04F